jgi:serine protease Do
VKVAGVYAAEDLVVLEVMGAPLTPVKWSFETPKLGGFLVAPQPDGRPAAFGVVSVLERNLRDTDQAFLGITGSVGYSGPGVKIDIVSKDTGAEAAGLKKGDVILKVGERAISGLLELKNALTGVVPGDKVSLWVDAGKGGRPLDVVVGNRPQLPQFSGQRLQQMERMGGPISQVRDSFTRVIQTDMRPKPNQVGGPVVDLQGRVMGITMARADRTRSFVMPSAAVVELLKQDAEDPELALATPDPETEEAPLQAGGPAPQGRMIPGGEERMMRHLSDMQRLMDHMRDEMEGLEATR